MFSLSVRSGLDASCGCAAVVVPAFCAEAPDAIAATHAPASQTATERFIIRLASPSNVVQTSLQRCFRNSNWFLGERQMVGSRAENGTNDRGSNGDDVPAPSRAIRDVRIGQGLSLRALSARAGLPYSTLSKLENGKMALTYDKLIRLAQALNVDLKDILASPDERAAPVAVGRRSVTRAGEALDAEFREACSSLPSGGSAGKNDDSDHHRRTGEKRRRARRPGPPRGRRISLRSSRIDGAALRSLCAAHARRRRLDLLRQRHGSRLCSHQR